MRARITVQRVRIPPNVDGSAPRAHLVGGDHESSGRGLPIAFATVHQWSWAVVVAQFLHGMATGAYFGGWCDIRCTRVQHSLARRSDGHADGRVSVRTCTEGGSIPGSLRILTHELRVDCVDGSVRQTS